MILNKNIAVVILNWNGKHWLEKFLPSVIKNSDGVRIIIGDNASTDDSIAFLTTNFPSIEILENKTNEGFAGGYQTILKKIDAEYYILLNSDVEVTSNWIEPIIKWMESDEKLVACQPKIKSFHQKEYFEYAGAAGGYIDKNGFLYCQGRIFNEIEVDTGQYNANKEIFWATGACLFIKSKAYHQVGGLDELFFAHVEEVDLCWRLRNAGYKIGYCYQSEIYHVGGGMLPQGNPRKTYLNFRNSLYLLFKNLPLWRLPYIFVKRTLLDVIAMLKAFVDGKKQDAFAITRAHYTFYCNLPKLIKRRNEMKASNVFIDDTFYNKKTGYYNGSIVWMFFIEGKRRFTEL
jgi:GT2 family glycosyltransferase